MQLALNVPEGYNFTPVFWIQGLASTGSTQYTASAAGLSTRTATIAPTPSGFVLAGPCGFGCNFTTSEQAPPTGRAVYPVQLDPTTLAFSQYQYLAPSAGTVNVPLTSSKTSVGTITISPVVFNPVDTGLSTAFDPDTSGTSQLSVGTPSGFTTPSNFRQITANVN